MSEHGPRRRERADYERGIPDYHDPTAGFGGAPPARSALTLRAWLAGFGLVVCLVGGRVAVYPGVTLVRWVVGAGLAIYLGVTWFAWLMGAVAVVAAVDLGWVLRRKARGEPG